MKTIFRLTKQQNAVIYCLQNGWQLITSCEMPGAIVANNEHEFRIGGRLLWNLVNKGLIYQSGEKHHFNYRLTSLGERIKTVPVKMF